MTASITTLASRVARAKRFFNEPEIFIGLGVGLPWPTDATPPTPIDLNQNVGWLSLPVYVGSSLSSANCTVALTTAPLLTSRTLVLTALSATTYEVRSGGVLVGTSPQTAGPTANTTIDVGLAFLVTNTTMTAGDTFTFQADGFTVGAKLCTEKYMVIPDSTGTITYRGQNWLIIDPATALAKGCNYVYVSSTFTYDELPVGVTFRQAGVFTGLVRAAGVGSSQPNLTPSQIQTVGFTEVLENRPPITRDISQIEKIRFIIEM